MVAIMGMWKNQLELDYRESGDTKDEEKSNQETKKMVLLQETKMMKKTKK